MSSETPGGVTSSTGENASSITGLPRVRSISDEITIYEITAPIPSKPTLKPLSFEIPQEQFFKSSPIKMSPQKLSPLSTSGNQNQKILSPTSLTILNPIRENHTSCEQLPQFVPSPSSQHVLLIPSKPELTVTVVSSPAQSETLIHTHHTSNSTSTSPVLLLPVPHANSSTESSKLETDLENVISCSNTTTVDEEKLPVRSKRQRRVFMPHQQKTMYRTRTMVKASLAAQIEKDELACEKKNEVPSVKPSAARALNLSLPSPPILSTYHRSGRKRSQRKLSTAEQLQLLKDDRSIDLENPGSILKLINLKNVLTRQNFYRLPLEDQIRLLNLLPDVDAVSESGKADQPSEDAFDNLFYNKACEDWKARLIAGDFTPEQKQKQKQEAEKDKAKVDPWKKKHFEPIWGFSDVKRVLQRIPPVEVLKPTLTAATVTNAEPPPLLISSAEPQNSLATRECPAPEVMPLIANFEENLEERKPSPCPTEPATSPSTPGKRDSTHLQTEESPILNKRLCRIESIIETETEENAVDSSQNEEHEETSPSGDLSEIDEALNMTPIPMVDNEVTIEHSPFELSMCPEDVQEERFVLQSVEQMMEEEFKCSEEFTEEVYVETTPVQEPDENFCSADNVIQEKVTEEKTESLSRSGSDVPPAPTIPVADIVRKHEPIETEATKLTNSMVQIETKAEEEAEVESKLEDDVQNEINLESEAEVGLNWNTTTPECFSEAKLPQALNQEINQGNWEEEQRQKRLEEAQSELRLQEALHHGKTQEVVEQSNYHVNLGDIAEHANLDRENEIQIQWNAQDETQMEQDQAQIQMRLEESYEIEKLTSIELKIEPEASFVETSTPNSLCAPIQSVANSIALQSLKTLPVPLGTTSIRVPISQESMNIGDRPSQPLIIRMVSIAPPNGPLPVSSSSVRLAPPPSSQPTPSLQPMVLKAMPGLKVDSMRNLVPKGPMDFIPVQPRTLIGLPEVVDGAKGASYVAIGQQSQSLTKMNGPGIGGSVQVQSPGSPGNVSLSNTKSSRHKPARQAKPKATTVPPGSVNLDRSYQICNAVVQSSPNREKLQAKLVKPPPLTPNNRIPRPDGGISVEGANAVIQMSRRACTPNVLQSTIGQIQVGTGSCVSPGQKMMVVNHQGMAPLIRPIQQLPNQTMSQHQIVVSSPSTSNGLGGSRALGMNVTFTTKHNPSTNNQTTTFTSTPNIITPQQLAVLLQQQQQHASSSMSRSPSPNLVSSAQRQPLQRPSVFVSRSPQQQSQQVKILSSSQFPPQSRMASPQILQLQQCRRPLSQDGMQFPIRAQIMTPNGETLTIHRAGSTGNMQQMRAGSPIRTNTQNSVVTSINVDSVKGLCSSTPPLTIINRTNHPPENRVQIVTNSSGNDSNHAQNLAEFITNQWSASNIRPISPLAFESERLVVQGRTPTKSQREALLHSTALAQNSSQINSAEMFVQSNVQTQKQHGNYTGQQHYMGLSELMSNVHDGIGDGGGGGNTFSVIKPHKNPGPPGSLEFIQIDRDRNGGGGSVNQNSNSPNGNSGPTNHNYSRTVVEGGSLVQTSQLDGQSDGLQQQQHYVIVQTTGSNGMPQNLVLQANLVMPPQQVKEEVKGVGDSEPPRAASAPPSNQPIVIGQQPQQQSNCNLNMQENKHFPLPVNFQDFSGLRVVYKDESDGNDRRMDFGMANNAPPSYTLTPVSGVGTGQDNSIVRVIGRNSSSGSPEVWNYSPVPPSSGHIVNVNLNGSSGSARIIPGQHPVISIPDTTNGSSSCSGLSSDFDLFSAIASTGSESGVKIENNGDTRSILIPVSMTNNNRQHFQSVGLNPGSGGVPNSRNCVCDLRAMTPCGKCGAFSHSDCLKNGMELCMGCVIR